MADSVEYNDERLRVIYDRMIDAGIDADEVSRLMKPLQDEFERRVCGLVWSHKTATQKMIQDMGQRLPLLTPSLDESIIQDENGRDHILVEGDNLYLLMAMQYTHIRNGHGVVDVIYIDPPYNTGSVTFDYNDRFEKSEWLSMMDVRLRLARNVMTDDGVMFISIDDNYQAELKLLCNDIFGYDKVQTVIWHKEYEGASGKMKRTKHFRDVHEYVVACYNNPNVQFNKIHQAAEIQKFQTTNLAKNKSNKTGDSSRIFNIVNPDNGLSWVDEWKYSREEIDGLQQSGLLYFGKDGKRKPRQILPTDDRREIYVESIITQGSSTAGRKDLETLLGKDVFKNPKPVKFIRTLIEIASHKSAIVLDFFAGSGTTMQAVLELNAEDGGHRQCILGTNNELGEDAVSKAEENGCVEGSPEWESFGVCQAVTLKRMQSVFPSHEHDNLCFYRISESEMVDSSIDDGGDITRMQMAQRAVPYISLREEVYADEAHDDESYHMLTSPTKHVMVVTDVNMLTTDIEALAEAHGIDGLVVYCPIHKSYDKSTVHYREYPREIIDALRHHQARARQVTQ